MILVGVGAYNDVQLCYPKAFQVANNCCADSSIAAVDENILLRCLDKYRVSLAYVKKVDLELA